VGRRIHWPELEKTKGVKRTHMSQTLILDVGKSVLAIFGGGGVVVTLASAYFSKLMAERTIEGRKAELNTELERTKAVLNAELERLKAELSKDSETHKLKLRKMELLFNRKLEVTQEFLETNRKIRPTYSHPDMDWHEACQQVAEEFGAIETELSNFMVKNGVILVASDRNELAECIQLASLHKFGLAEGGSAAKEAFEKAGELITRLGVLETQLLNEVQSQSS
jgi:uncharacterized small protein (DUF1192 family)